MSTTKIISFDLDDTLYDNTSVVENAELASRQILHQQFANQNKACNFQQLERIQHRLHDENPLLAEDVTNFRKQCLNLFCQDLADAEGVVEQVFEQFYLLRQTIVVDPKILNMVKALAEKYILVSVSNGNADPNQLTFGPYFNRHYSPIMGYRAKPNPSMLTQVMADYSLIRNELIHVGDSLTTDAIAAKKAKVKFIHFQPFQSHQSVEQNCKRLLHLINPIEWPKVG